jgi:hypothetical protein
MPSAPVGLDWEIAQDDERAARADYALAPRPRRAAESRDRGGGQRTKCCTDNTWMLYGDWQAKIAELGQAVKAAVGRVG